MKGRYLKRSKEAHDVVILSDERLQGKSWSQAPVSAMGAIIVIVAVAICSLSTSFKK